MVDRAKEYIDDGCVDKFTEIDQFYNEANQVVCTNWCPCTAGKS